MPPALPVRLSPCTTEVPLRPGPVPEHDLFIQNWKLKNTLRWLAGEEQITHLGRQYCE